MSRAGSFLFGVVIGIAAVAGGAVLFIRNGGMRMETTAPPLPFEQQLAGMAIRASIGNAGAQPNPLPLNDENLLAGARVFKENCAVCHTAPNGTRSAPSKGMFPLPPQLFTPNQMVTDDPQGVIYWVVTNGIRLSAMPGFVSTLSDTERWQVAMLLGHADKLPPAVQAALSH